MTKAKHILFLNKVDHSTLSTKELKVSCQALIKTIPYDFSSALWDKNIPWVITSRTAADLIVSEELAEVIYAIGPKTAQHFPQAIYPTSATAQALAEFIIEKGEKEVLFICGEQRRNELPDLLKRANIKLKEAVVYRTEFLQKNLNLQCIDGLAFMSPSSVISITQNGGFNKLPCFAIGPTTAQKLIEHGQEPIISKKPNAESIMQAAKAYFNR